MLLTTDSVAGASPEIIASIAAVGGGDMLPYGEDDVTKRLSGLFGELFAHDVEVFPTVSGTASNALALSLAATAYSAVYCHESAHVLTGEMGAFEFYTQGSRLIGLPGKDGKLSPDILEKRLARDTRIGGHPSPSAVSITQLSEAGTFYTPEEISSIGEVTRRYGLVLHMDGARFANAVAAMRCTPAEASVGGGVDILSFGGTKNGTLMADAIVVFKPGIAAHLAPRRKRAGLTVAKMRFISAQLEAYLADGLWLRNASSANAKMQRLVESIEGLPGVMFEFPPQGNELFLGLSPIRVEGLDRNGIALRRKSLAEDGRSIYRLVTSFATRDEEVDAVTTAIRYGAKAE